MEDLVDAVGGPVVPGTAAALSTAVARVEVARGEIERTRRCNDRGMVSAEWAVGIIAAIAVAGVLLSVVTSGGVEKAILGFILEVISHFADGFGRV